MKLLKGFIVFPLCLLTACAPPKTYVEFPENKLMPAKKPAANVEEHKARTTTVVSWEINGSMSAKNKTKGWSATMNWTQQGPSSYQIRLMGPLGAGTVLVTKKGGVITLQDGPKTLTSNSADELLMQQTGIRLPVNNLYYWIRGLPAPGGVQAEHHDQNNHLDQLKQSGYTIDYTKYTTVKNIDLPSMIRLQGNGVTVKIAIKNWTI